MPTLIRWRDGAASTDADPFARVDDDVPLPEGDVIVSLARFRREGDLLLSQPRRVGVVVEAVVLGVVAPRERGGEGRDATAPLKPTDAVSLEPIS